MNGEKNENHRSNKKITRKPRKARRLRNRNTKQLRNKHSRNTGIGIHRRKQIIDKNKHATRKAYQKNLHTSRKRTKQATKKRMARRLQIKTFIYYKKYNINYH